MKELPTRKKIRLDGYEYSSAGCYFVTVCVKDRCEMLGSVTVGAATCRPFVTLSDTGLIVDRSINNINSIYPHVLVDKYVIMPNHVHLLLIQTSAYNGRQVAAPTRTLHTVCFYAMWVFIMAEIIPRPYNSL